MKVATKQEVNKKLSVIQNFNGFITRTIHSGLVWVKFVSVTHFVFEMKTFSISCSQLSCRSGGKISCFL